MSFGSWEIRERVLVWWAVGHSKAEEESMQRIGEDDNAARRGTRTREPRGDPTEAP
ncbi:hypothetical protein [Streptomyces sp. NPDC005438]|uniref:hypothetical protein n=1 Tax=Streptomyces sp. NPDC005438 TaxID=3156880 RepID=UPI0033B17135